MNCKPGDLAYVIASENVGAVVEVECASDAFDDGSPAWRCTSRSPLKTIGRKTGKRLVGTKFRVRDSWLRPIAGPSVTEESNRRFLNPIVLTDDLLESIGVRS